MDTLKKVSGAWRGTYGYEASEQMAKRDPVAFTLTLKQGWFGKFTGTVAEHGSGSMPGVGVIEGYFAFPRIEFTKRMPVCYVATPDGRTITMRENLIEHGDYCEREVPHPPIFYQGEFSSSKRAEGAWTPRATRLPLGDGRVVPMDEVNGVWSIEI